MQDFYFGNDSKRRTLSQKGLIRKIAKGVYTSIMDDVALEKSFRDHYNWALIVAHAFSHCTVSYRTALEFKPSPEGHIFLSSSKNHQTTVAGITFKEIRTDIVHSQTDRDGMMGAKCACLERAMLELYRVPRITPHDDRYVDRELLENRLETILKDGGEEKLNAFRDKARTIATELDLLESFKRLEADIAAILGTGILEGKSERLIKRAAGYSVDKSREVLFEKLASDLSILTPPDLIESITDPLHHANKAFFESYFSNYIEGTEFLIEEAEEIIFQKHTPINRPEDAHDIAGTFEVVSNEAFMKRAYGSCQEFLKDLQLINKSILPLRADKAPGEWKEISNKAGNTLFVHPSEVLGTLTKGYDIAQRLHHPFLRAIFLAFVVSEVHPFRDGNGRTCRVVLNRELKRDAFSTLIIPTVYRDDYLGALRQPTRRGLSSGYYRMFLRAWKFSHLDFTHYQEVKAKLKSLNWFEESSEARIVE